MLARHGRQIVAMRHLLFIVALISTGLLPAGEPAEATAAMADAQSAAATVDPALAERLETEASRRLRQEFVNQPARLDIGRVQVREAGGYLALLADGQADFGAEGKADATVRALYDPRSGKWLRLDYDLGDGG
jgi:hypothetical protein